MPVPLKALVLACAAVLSGAAGAAGAARIGLAAPLDGPLAALGEQMRDGAALAVAQAGAELVAANDQCSAEGGAAAAQRFVEAQVDAVAGFLCTEAIEAALPILAEAGIAVVTPGARADALTDHRHKTGWLVWRAGPRADGEASAIADILPRLWRRELFAIVDDGTVYGRDLSETFRLAAETAGLKPVFVDTFRPQSDNQIGLAARLRRAGATHVFVGGDREDAAQIARDAAGLDHALTVAGGEALRAAGETPLSPGTLMIGLPEWADTADPGVLAQFAQAGVEPEGYALPAYAAAEIALEAVRRARAGSTSVPDALSGGTFETAIGPLAFDAKGDLTRNPFRLLRHDGARFVPAE